MKMKYRIIFKDLKPIKVKDSIDLQLNDPNNIPKVIKFIRRNFAPIPHDVKLKRITVEELASIMRKRDSSQGKMVAFIFDRNDGLYWIIENGIVVYAAFGVKSEWSIKSITNHCAGRTFYVLIGYGVDSVEWKAFEKKKFERFERSQSLEWKRDEDRREWGRRKQIAYNDLKRSYFNILDGIERRSGKKFPSYRGVKVDKLARKVMHYVNENKAPGDSLEDAIREFLSENYFTAFLNIVYPLARYIRILKADRESGSSDWYGDFGSLARTEAEMKLKKAVKEKRYKAVGREYTYIDRSGYEVNLGKYLMQLGSRVNTIPMAVRPWLTKATEGFNDTMKRFIAELQRYSELGSWNKVTALNAGVERVLSLRSQYNVDDLSKIETYKVGEEVPSWRIFKTEREAILELKEFLRRLGMLERDYLKE